VPAGTTCLHVTARGQAATFEVDADGGDGPPATLRISLSLPTS
jgi:hypothetical protein